MHNAYQHRPPHHSLTGNTHKLPLVVLSLSFFSLSLVPPYLDEDGDIPANARLDDPFLFLFARIRGR